MRPLLTLHAPDRIAERNESGKIANPESRNAETGRPACIAALIHHHQLLSVVSGNLLAGIANRSLERSYRLLVLESYEGDKVVLLRTAFRYVRLTIIQLLKHSGRIEP